MFTKKTSLLFVVTVGVSWIGFWFHAANGIHPQEYEHINCTGFCSPDDLQCNGTVEHTVCKNTCNITLYDCTACVSAWEMIYYNDTGKARYIHLQSSCFRTTSRMDTIDRCIHDTDPFQLTDPDRNAIRTIYSCQCHENLCNKELKRAAVDQQVSTSTTVTSVIPTTTSVSSTAVSATSTQTPSATTSSTRNSTVQSLFSTSIPDSRETVVASDITLFRSNTAGFSTTNVTPSRRPQPTSVYHTAIPPSLPTVAGSSDSSSHMQMALIVGIAVPIVTLLALAVFLFMVSRLRRYDRSKLDQKNGRQRLNSIYSFVSDSGLGSGSSTCNIDFQELQLQNVLKCGRFGVVWKAKFRGEDVAVKIFQDADRTTWLTEKDYLQDPSLAHDHIVQFIAADTKEIGDGREYWLVMTYYERGNLSDFLKGSILTWNNMLSLGKCLVSAVAYLHSESDTDGVRKISVAHRDIKSANVLVRSDHTCVLADFGMGIRLREDVRQKELASSGQCGTPRYMSPEALDCRVNLEDLNSFKQMDVYAMGLILWEIANRCNHTGVRKYTLPYQEEVGQKPSIATMRSVVLVQKRRPMIPQEWRTNRGMNIIAETMEECWDEDAEARLPAHCVERRFQESLLPMYTLGSRTRSKTSSVASLQSIIPKGSGQISESSYPTTVELPEKADTDSEASLQNSLKEELNESGDYRRDINQDQMEEDCTHEASQRDIGTVLEETDSDTDGNKYKTDEEVGSKEREKNHEVAVDMSVGNVLCNTLARGHEEV